MKDIINIVMIGTSDVCWCATHYEQSCHYNYTSVCMWCVISLVDRPKLVKLLLSSFFFFFSLSHGQPSGEQGVVKVVHH